jgi:hypothetical protein
MPWFPELLVANHLEPVPSPDSWQTVPFYQGIMDMTPECLLASWAGPPAVEDPRVGPVTGSADFVDYARATREWLALADAQVVAVSVLNSAGRSVEEVVLELCVAGERHQLPVAVVAEWDLEHRLTSIRIYHSLWPLFPNHDVHVPAIPAQDHVRLPSVIRQNQRAREAEDPDAILATYEADAVVCMSGNGPRTLNTPAGFGGAGTSAGADELRRLYATPSVAGTKPVMEIRTATDDGRRCAVEFQVTRFSEPHPEQVGLTVFELGVTGRIARERSYRVARSTPLPADVWTHPARPPGRIARRAHLALVPRENAELAGD